jgi:hypothetical protein
VVNNIARVLANVKAPALTAHGVPDTCKKELLMTHGRMFVTRRRSFVYNSHQSRHIPHYFITSLLQEV